jgi:hypothetical protein
MVVDTPDKSTEEMDSATTFPKPRATERLARRVAGSRWEAIPAPHLSYRHVDVDKGKHIWTCGGEVDRDNSD